ncbi:MAG: pirin family protein [Actinomycetota bacterium]|nr:pirin family protein [Actinomycetota bacterium]
MTVAASSVTLVPSARRRHVQAGWYDSRQSFSGPGTGQFGHLVVHNESTIAPVSGFPLHGHQDMEIVTWIFSGVMDHADTEGNQTTIFPGLAQRMSAGSGIRHTEMNPSRTQPSHGVQMWVVPDQRVEPSYAQADVSADLDSGALVPVASGSNSDAALSLHQRGATLWAARLVGGVSVEVPDGAWVHLFVPIGSADLEAAGRLSAGDAARMSRAGSRRLQAAADLTEILIWQMT